MNKLLPILALLLATPILAADEAALVEITARYEGLDPAYGQRRDSSLSGKSQTKFVMPKVAIRSGKKAITRDVQEYVFSGDDVKNLGHTIEISPTIVDGQIQAIGHSSICTLTSPPGKDLHHLSSFKTIETYFRNTFPNNKEVAIKLSDDTPGTLYLTFTLLNSEGLPVK